MQPGAEPIPKAGYSSIADSSLHFDRSQRRSRPAKLKSEPSSWDWPGELVELEPAAPARCCDCGKGSWFDKCIMGLDKAILRCTGVMSDSERRRLKLEVGGRVSVALMGADIVPAPKALSAEEQRAGARRAQEQRNMVILLEEERKVNSALAAAQRGEPPPKQRQLPTDPKVAKLVQAARAKSPPKKEQKPRTTQTHWQHAFEAAKEAWKTALSGRQSSV